MTSTEETMSLAEVLELDMEVIKKVSKIFSDHNLQVHQAGIHCMLLAAYCCTTLAEEEGSPHEHAAKFAEILTKIVEHKHPKN